MIYQRSLVDFQKKTFCLALLLFSSYYVFAQRKLTDKISFERISTQKWFDQTGINCMVQDAYGYLWFGTSTGLVRYDGYGIQEFQHDPYNNNSIPHNSINCLYLDKFNQLWIGTWGGLCRLDPATMEFLRYKHDPRNLNTIAGNDVRAICQDRFGNLWVGTYGGGISKYLRYSDSFQNFYFKRGASGSLSSNNVTFAQAGQDGFIWIGTRSGLDRLDPNTHKIVNFNVNGIGEFRFNNDWFTCYMDSPDGKTAYLGSYYSGLFILDKASGMFYPYDVKSLDGKGFGPSRITTLCYDMEGRLWAGSNEGLLVHDFRNNTSRILQNDPRDYGSINNDDVRHIFTDRSGLVWVITVQGVSNYSKLKDRFSRFQRDPNNPNSLSNNNVTCFAEDKGGNLWIGTREGLNYYNRNQNSFTGYFSNDRNNGYSLSSNEINALHVDNKGQVWVGTSNGLNCLDPWRGTVKTYRYDPASSTSQNNEILAIAQDRMGQLWLGCRKGLLKFNESDGSFELFRPAPAVDDAGSSNSVYAIKEDRFGSLWVGTIGSGLGDFNRQTRQFTLYQNKSGDSTSISNNGVVTIFEDKLGFLWVGTFGGGLNRFERKTKSFTNYPLLSRKPNEQINAIAEDANNNLWISSNRGIIKFDTKTRNTRLYDVLDGLQARQFNMGAGLKLRTGELVFGGIAGFNIFDPLSIFENKHLPPLGITSFRVLDKYINPNLADLVFNHDQNFITIDFSSLSFALIDKNRYAYMLEGFDEDWILSGAKHSASYGNLPPGKYTFRFKAANSDGLWNEEGKALEFIILRPFWRTWWFISLSILLLLISIIFTIRWRTRSVDLRNRWLEENVKERTRALEVANQEAEKARIAAENASRIKSGFLANMSHEIRTPLNGIIGFTELMLKNEKNSENQKYLQHIRSSGDTLLKLLSDILDLSKIEQGKLNIENIDFNFQDVIQSTLLPYQFRAREKGLQFKLEFDKDIPDFVNSDPTRIKQLAVNLVSNSLKFTESGGILVRFEAESKPTINDQSFYITGKVADTGIGISPDAQKLIFESFTQADGSFTRKYGGSGLGLAIVKQLLRLMNGDIKVYSPSPDQTFQSQSPGALFTFRFKVKARLNVMSDALSQDMLKHNGHKFLTPKRVLLVEDNQINQLLATTILESFGAKIDTAEDGLQGFEKAKANHYDIILMDVQMPVMNGYESTQAIRKYGIQTPIIGLTANVYQEDIEKCIESGMNSHLGKPFTEEDLFHTMQRWM